MGDKTIAFWLMDKEMYTGAHRLSVLIRFIFPDPESQQSHPDPDLTSIKKKNSDFLGPKS